jgi:hypothetical protein
MAKKFFIFLFYLQRIHLEGGSVDIWFWAVVWCKTAFLGMLGGNAGKIDETRATRERWPFLTVESEWGLKEFKWKGSFLCRFVELVVPVQEICFPPWLWRPYKIFFPYRTLFLFLCPHRPASWAGSLAGSPVSEYVSLVEAWEARGRERSEG